MSDALFVYGSLRSEFDNRYALELRAEADLVGSAAVAGSIFRVGRYPGYREEPEGEVRGEVWRLRNPERTLAMLDEYEGGRYRRVLTRTSIPGVEAWIYQYQGEVDAALRIESGDFLAS
ncbi:MAG TPA: gamma-glutamylcyclotransferase family protein [Bryobacteraceae bacterium]|nr:gamma-glutamylcyclotransferase family protein [Bryobacteraceae bacterium]